MKRPKSLTAKLKICDVECRNYVFALETENAKLQRQIAKLEVKDVSNQHKIAALKKMQPRIKIMAYPVNKPATAGQPTEK